MVQGLMYHLVRLQYKGFIKKYFNSYFLFSEHIIIKNNPVSVLADTGLFGLNTISNGI